MRCSCGPTAAIERTGGLVLALLVAGGLGAMAGEPAAAAGADHGLATLEHCTGALDRDGPTATAACIAKLLPALERRADVAMARALSATPEMRRKSELRALDRLWREWRERKCGFLSPPGRAEGTLRYIERAVCLHEETERWVRYLEGLAGDPP